MVSQYALQVVSQHALQVSGGGVVVSQHALQVSRPTPKGEVEGSGLGGSPGLHLGVSQHALIQSPPSRRSGYCCGRYASYWNAFLLLLKFQWQHSLQELDLSWNVYPGMSLDLAMRKLSDDPKSSKLEILNLSGTSISCYRIKYVKLLWISCVSFLLLLPFTTNDWRMFSTTIMIVNVYTLKYLNVFNDRTCWGWIHGELCNTHCLFT